MDYDINEIAQDALKKLKEENNKYDESNDDFVRINGDGSKEEKNTSENTEDEDYSDFYDSIRKEVEEEGEGIYENSEEENDKEEDLTKIKITRKPPEEYYENEMSVPCEIEDEIYPGGPSTADLEMWKKEYGESNVFLVAVQNDTFIVRTLNRYEHKQITAIDNINALQREELICQTVTLYPYDYTWQGMAVDKAGIPSTLSSYIMDISGFTKDVTVRML